jgi:hypothetical protein
MGTRTIHLPLHEDALPWSLEVCGEAGQSGPHRHEEWELLARDVVARLRRTLPEQFFAILRLAMPEQKT